MNICLWDEHLARQQLVPIFKCSCPLSSFVSIFPHFFIVLPLQWLKPSQICSVCRLYWQSVQTPETIGFTWKEKLNQLFTTANIYLLLHVKLKPYQRQRWVAFLQIIVFPGISWHEMFWTETNIYQQDGGSGWFPFIDRWDLDNGELYKTSWVSPIIPLGAPPPPQNLTKLLRARKGPQTRN